MISGEHRSVRRPCRWLTVDGTRMLWEEAAVDRRHLRCGCHLGKKVFERVVWGLS